MQQHESWAGNIMGWVFGVGGSYTLLGMSWPTIIIFGLTAWWTVERALAERARARAYDRMAVDQAPVRRSLFGALMRRRGEPAGLSPTDVGELDSQPQAHHDGK